jgi:membrane protease YdiL (CAAX protease family)
MPSAPRPPQPSHVTALRLIAFLVVAAGAVLAVGPVAGAASALFGLGADHPAVAWLFPVLVTAALVAVTAAALRLDGEGLGAIGLVPTRRRSAEFVVGLGVGSLLMAAVALARAASVGAAWAFGAGAGAQAALLGLPLALLMLLPEELVFRGYAFRKAASRWGAPAALTASSLLFGAYHVVGSGYWGAGAAFLFAMPALGGLVFGAAALRTDGLALPVGLHLGGNWVMASVVGLGAAEGRALWAAPVDASAVAALTAPDLWPHLPYLVAVALMALAVRAWTRRPAV